MALRVLFQYDLGGVPVRNALARELEEEALSPREEEFLRNLVSGTVEKLAQIDSIISSFARGWDVMRMGAVDRNLLRMAVYEMLHIEDIPVSVSINEAVELAKKYGDEDSPAFINGILASVARSNEPGAGQAR